MYVCLSFHFPALEAAPTAEWVADRTEAATEATEFGFLLNDWAHAVRPAVWIFVGHQGTQRHYDHPSQTLVCSSR